VQSETHEWNQLSGCAAVPISDQHIFIFGGTAEYNFVFTPEKAQMLTLDSSDKIDYSGKNVVLHGDSCFVFGKEPIELKMISIQKIRELVKTS
jgi:hypothetical protein